MGDRPAPAGKLIQSLADEVAVVDIEGTRAWMPAELVSEAQESVPATQAPVRLLPAFDQSVIAATRHAANLLPGRSRSASTGPRAGCRR